MADSIDQLMMRVRDHYKVTSIVITHDMRCARRMGQRIIYLRDGQVYLDALLMTFSILLIRRLHGS